MERSHQQRIFAVYERFPPPPLPLPTRPLAGSDTVNKIPEALMNAKFVYVRRGGQTPPLSPLYSSPYEVLEAGRKVFKISIGGKIEMFTVGTD
jgi:hypothetical protein